jgi:hypothetical protein
VESTGSVSSEDELVQLEAEMLASAAKTIICSQKDGSYVSGVSSSSAPKVTGKCESYKGSNHCYEVEDSMTLHVDGVGVSHDDLEHAGSTVVGQIKSDTKSGLYNHGSIVRVKVIGAQKAEGRTFSSKADPSPTLNSPILTASSTSESASEPQESKSLITLPFALGLGLACAGLVAVALFAMRKKKDKEEVQELDNLAQAYYDDDERFAKFGPWDVLSLSNDSRTMTSSIIDPALNPAETSKDVHVCSSAMCTECTRRKNRSQRVQFIPSIPENALGEYNHDDEEKSF